MIFRLYPLCICVSVVCEQQRRKPACAFTQSDQRPCFSRYGKNEKRTFICAFFVVCDQQRRSPACASVQSDQRPGFSRSEKNEKHTHNKLIKILASIRL